MRRISCLFSDQIKIGFTMALPRHRRILMKLRVAQRRKLWQLSCYLSMAGQNETFRLAEVGGWKVCVTLSEGDGGKGKGEGEGWLLHGWGLLCYWPPPSTGRTQGTTFTHTSTGRTPGHHLLTQLSCPQGPGALTPSIPHIQQLWKGAGERKGALPTTQTRSKPPAGHKAPLLANSFPFCILI